MKPLRQIAALIRSMRLLTDQMDIFTCEPHNDLLHNRSWNEAYCTANPGVEYAVFFPDGGRLLSVRWLDIRESRRVGAASAVEAEDTFVRLITPTEEGYWAALVHEA